MVLGKFSANIPRLSRIENLLRAIGTVARTITKNLLMTYPTYCNLHPKARRGCKRFELISVFGQHPWVNDPVAYSMTCAMILLHTTWGSPSFMVLMRPLVKFQDEFNLVVNSVLDREVHAELNVSILCSDSGSPQKVSTYYLQVSEKKSQADSWRHPGSYVLLVLQFATFDLIDLHVLTDSNRKSNPNTIRRNIFSTCTCISLRQWA